MPSNSPLPVPANPAPAGLVGVFDSGVGGLSVLSALHERMPQVPMLYMADSAHAPYGERSDDYVIDRTERIFAHLLGRGASLLVVACNTATAVAVAAVRRRWPEVPVVGVEPAIKPAVKSSPSGRIGVMATPATLRSEKFRRLLEQHGAGAEIHLQPCPGLAGAIEHGDLNDPALLALIEGFCAPLRAAAVDTVVLGCTHYPFVRGHIQAAMGSGVQLIDTALPVAQQAWRLMGSPQPPAAQASAVVQLESTGQAEHLARVARHWLSFDCEVLAAPVL